MALKEKVTIGIDIGGSKIAAGVLKEGQLIDDIIKEQTPKDGAASILQLMSKMIKELQVKYSAQAVGISTAGMVNNKGEMLGSCGNIPHWKGTAVKAELESMTGLAVTVENDANCAAFGEYMLGCAKNYNPILLVILGTGLGGGIVYDEKIWTGSHFGGGEIGHIKISDSGRRACTCGSIDCWEAYASGTALEVTAREVFNDPNMDNYQLIELYKNSDKRALEVMDIWHKYIALGMASMMNTFDPECIVVSGGMAEFVDYQKLQILTEDKVVDALKAHVTIIPGVLANNSGMIGAACLANLL